MANHHGTQSGFHPSPPRRQPLCSGGASQEQLCMHTQRGQQGPEKFPARHILQGWCSEAMPPSCRCPAEHARGDATSPGGLPTPGLQQRRIFFPTTTMGNHMAAAGFPTCWHTVPVQHSHAVTANSGKCTQARQSLSPTCPGLPRRSPPWRGGQGCPQGHHHLHAHP